MRRSDLAALAPPGGAVGVALATVEDAAAAADAGPPVFVDGEAVAVAGGDGAEHLAAGGIEDGAELRFGDVGEAAPGIDLGGEAGLALEDVADAGGEALVEQGVAEGARLVASAQTQIELEATRARESLRKDVAGLAVRAAAKVLEREIDATTHAELLNKLATQI